MTATATRGPPVAPGLAPAEQLLEHGEPEGAEVYFARRGPFVKIGCTAHIHRRKAMLRYHRDPDGHDGDVQVLLTLPGGRITEGWMHARFAESACEGSGEWFHADQQVLGFVAHMLRCRLLIEDAGLERGKMLLLEAVQEAMDGRAQAPHT
jgi:hypothetical protein